MEQGIGNRELIQVHFYSTPWFLAGTCQLLLRDVCVDQVSSLENAVVASVKAHKDFDVAVVPEGPYVIPNYRVPSTKYQVPSSPCPS